MFILQTPSKNEEAPEAGAGRAGGDGLAVAAALVGGRLLVCRQVVLAEAAQDRGQPGHVPLVAAPGVAGRGEGGEAHGLQLVGEPLGLVSHGPVDNWSPVVESECDQ